MVSKLSQQMSGAGMMSKVKSMAGMGPSALAGMRGNHGHGMPKMKGSTKHKPKFKQKKRKRK